MNPALERAEEAFHGWLVLRGGDPHAAPALMSLDRIDDNDERRSLARAYFADGPVFEWIEWTVIWSEIEHWPWPELDEFIDLYERMRGRRVTMPRPPIEIVNLAIERINPLPINAVDFTDELAAVQERMINGFIEGMSQTIQQTLYYGTDFGGGDAFNGLSPAMRELLRAENHRRRREVEEMVRQINPPLLEAPQNLTATEIEERWRVYPVRTSLPRGTWRLLHGGAGVRGAIDAAAKRKSLQLLRSWLTVKQRVELRRYGYFHAVGSLTKTRYRIHRGRAMNIQVLDDKSGKPVHGICFMPNGNLPVGDVMLAQKLTLELQEEEALAKANVFDLGAGVLYGPGQPTMEDWRFLSRIATIDTTEEGGLSFRGIPIRQVEQLTPEPQPVPRRERRPSYNPFSW